MRPRRRGLVFRRLLFAGAVLACVAGGELTAQASTQEPRLAAREIRVTRSEAGDYRVLEILDVETGAESKAPLTLVQLPETASRFAGAGADLEPTDLLFEAPMVSILRWPASSDLVQVLISYEIPGREESLDFVSPLRTDELGLSLARGGVHARVDGRLEAAGQVGSAASPRRRFLTSDVAAGTAIELKLAATKIDWRQRLAVLLGAALAITWAAIRVWRS